ncbi:phBC6A51 family helix-turn-helix protein [Bacillus sp. FJAT-47783]|uniref:phBC6A51 family helix-turn-helix protein n=1 Tax=Bacillus sp. FJAT-47783 TaxID=2922712 RepID=UPI001FAE0F01|nr:phBC6A51 family helix-turn-helix protein [Bacillus sp. FJAT-47783]
MVVRKFANEFAPKDEKKTYEEIAEEVGIAIRALYNWCQSPDFTRYRSVISDNKPDNYRALAGA